ncbi:vacuolar protein sorting/targeting protein PEP1, partial [Kickxella alabastrina]
AGDRAGSAITALLGDGKPVAKCLWARQTKEFEAMAEAAIFCLEIVPESETAENKRSLDGKRSLASDIAGILDKQTPRSTVQLTASEDFFSTKRTVHFGSGNDGTGGDRAGGGVVAVSVVKNYLMAAISHAHSNEMDLFVSMDGHTWAESRLPLPPGAEEDAYTILESTAHSVLVDVQTSSAGALGTLFRSNSNGTYYTASLEHTHRAASGLVDVERVHGVEGVIIANQVANWEQIGRGIGGILHREKLELKSRISFNDGARWHFLQPPKKDLDGKAFGCSRDGWETGQCALHLHSVTSTRTPGRVFGSPSAAGVILAVGNVGSQLAPWRECDTFLSRDGGITWKMVHREAHHVQLADSGSVLILANDEVPTDVLTYSLDSGDTWTNAALDQKMRISALFIDDDGLSPVVLAVGTAREGAHNHEQVVVSVDFAKSWSRQCSLDPKDPKAGKDTELFVMSSHDDDDCIMGHRSEHIRRKPSADCFMRLDQVLLPLQTDCDCATRDFECDYNYALDQKGQCELVGREVIPRGQCLHKGDRFDASSGYRLIPGNTCVRGSRTKDLDKPVDKLCPRVQPPNGDNSNGDDHAHEDNNKGEVFGPVSHHTMVMRGEPHIMTFPNSTSFLLMTSGQELYRSDDEGAKWIKVDLAASTGNAKVGKPVYLTAHRYHSSRAFAYTDADLLLFTGDRGATWSQVRSLPSPANSLHIRPLLDFNPTNPDWLLFVGGTACPGCHSEIWLSPDNGQKWTRITTHATKCQFARSKEFTAADLPAESVICTNYRLTSGNGNEQDRQAEKRNPDNYVEIRVFTQPFRDSTFRVIPLPHPERSEIVDMHIYSRFIIAAVIETVTDDAGRPTTALKMFVSDDGKSVHEARFPPGTNIKPEAFTLLPAHAGTVLIDVEGAPNSAGDSDWGTGWGTLFASNSNGTHFHMVLQHTNRNRQGLVDIERVDGLEGMLIANRVVNAEALGKPGVHKLLRTVASWDDGRSWHPLAAPQKDSSGRDIDCIDCSLHLYSRSSMLGMDALYGVSSAPGYLMGVGSVGTHLGRYKQARTYLSSDGGITWAEIRNTDHMYEFGDHGALLVLVDDSNPTDSLQYSVDGGSTWKSYRFTTGGTKVIVDRITNGEDSGGQGILILAREIMPSGGPNFQDTMVIYVDFSKLHARQCHIDKRDHLKSDFELWTPRWVGAGSRSGGRDEAICVLGSETSYWRRKATAGCFVGNEFDPPETSTRPCECTVQDYECDEGFWLNDYGECTLDGPDPYQPADCHDGNMYKGRSGYLKNSQSQCTGGKDLTRPVDRVCGRAGGLHATAFVLDSPVADMQYFKNSHHIVARTESDRVWVSLDEGSRWLELSSASESADSRIVDVIRHPYFEDYAYFVPAKGTIAMYTDDEARTTRTLHLPTSPAHAMGPVLRFHPDTPDWLIYHGQPNAGCGTTVDAGRCHVEAFVSRDHGAHWDALVTPVGSGGCSFLKSDRLTKAQHNTVVCARHPDARNGGGDIVVSDNWFTKNEHILVSNSTDYTIMGGFLLMSQDVEDGKSLRMHISLDGVTAAVAKFPGDKLTMDSAYTVLEPPEGFEYRDLTGRNHKMPGAGLMMHVTKSSRAGAEWGSIYTSNSNGTYYRRTLEYVNRDENGLVDFERVRALEGVSIANTVANPEDVLKTNKPKRLQTRITNDGGSRWHFLRVQGPQTPCKMTAPASGTCALHLHGYTEVSDPENIYSSAGAVGLVMGVGTVGASLGRIGQSDMYLSRDGGVEWALVHKGPMWHEFGDHGGLIVVADRIHPISEVEYSLDQGRTWLSLKLPEEARAMRVEFLTTTPDSTSRRFVMYGKKDGGSKGIVVGLDFTGVQPRMCQFDPLDEKNHENKDDFELFIPKHIDLSSDQDGCVLGRKVQYYRRISDRACYVGDEFRPVRYLSETCECSERDYECNYNFERSTSSSDNAFGKCVLVKGMQAPRTNCTDDHEDYFIIEAAYRKLPQSVCRNGLVLDRPKEVWCPGKARSVAIFWSLFLPFFFLSLAYVAYHMWRSRYPYLRLEDIGTAVGPALRRHLRVPNANSGIVEQLQPVFFGALSTAKAVGSAAKEGFLWTVDRAAPFLPQSIQRWSYDHPPRWGSSRLSMDGRSRRDIRSGEGGSRFTYHPLSTNEAAGIVFGDGTATGASASARRVDEYDEVEAGFSHFLHEDEEEDRFGSRFGEDDA